MLHWKCGDFIELLLAQLLKFNYLDLLRMSDEALPYRITFSFSFCFFQVWVTSTSPLFSAKANSVMTNLSLS